MIVISFVDLQKISVFPKFGWCGSKIEPATPISILNFSRVWQSYLESYALQILVSDRSFTANIWYFHHFFVSVPRKLKFEKSSLFFSRVSPTWYKKSWLWTITYQLGDTQEKKNQFFWDFGFSVIDTKNW